MHGLLKKLLGYWMKAILILLIVSGNLAAQSPPPIVVDQNKPSAEKAKAKQESAKKNAPPLLPSKKEKRTDKADVSNRNEQESGLSGWMKRWWDDPVAVTTGLLVFVVGLQWWWMWRQEKTVKAQLRAYVFIDDISIAGLPERGDVHIVIRNGGKTPAYRFTCRAAISHQRPAVPFVAPRELTALLPVRADIPPGGRFLSTFRNSFSEETLTSMRAGQSAFYLSGIIRYRDAFRTDQSTQFRYIFLTERGVAEGHWEATPEGSNKST